MAGTGLIFRSDKDIDGLPPNWEPEPLGEREVVVKKLETLIGQVISRPRVSLHPRLWLELELEEGASPRCITVSGVWGDAELEMIRRICTTFGARFYDSQE